MNSRAEAEPAKRILVIEDEKPFREILEQVLRRDGFEVCGAGDGEEAMALMREHLFDLVIADLILPGKEGIEVILDLRTLEPGIPIIAMSGGAIRGNGDFLPLAKRLGARAVLQKPFEYEALNGAIRVALDPGEPQLAN